MNRRYVETALRAEHRCEYCRAPEAVFNFSFEVEHVGPSSRGGADDLSNWALACRSCNLYKADRLTAIDPESGGEVRLVSPRQDRWDERFRVDAENGTIHGVTPLGRATIQQLEMNSLAQAAARRQWKRLGLYP